MPCQKFIIGIPYAVPLCLYSIPTDKREYQLDNGIVLYSDIRQRYCIALSFWLWVWVRLGLGLGLGLRVRVGLGVGLVLRLGLGLELLKLAFITRRDRREDMTGEHTT